MNLIFIKEMIEVSIKQHEKDIMVLQKILEKAEVPTWWYRVIWKRKLKGVDEKINISPTPKGIRVYIPKGKEIKKETMANDWLSAAIAVADYLEERYAIKVRETAMEFKMHGEDGGI